MASTRADGREKKEEECRCYVNPVGLLYFSGFLDLFGVSIIIPLILPYARDLGASPSVAGALDSMYGALQLFSSPVLGQWSDRKGRHWSLSLCLMVAGLGYMSMGLVTSIPLLLLARIPLGVFKHSQSFSRTYLADLVPEERRSSVLGHFNAASSMGFILGPIVGGHVAELPGGFLYASFLGGGVFCFNAALVWFLLPTTTTTKTPQASPDDNNEESSTAALQKDDSDSSPSLKAVASGEGISFSPRSMLCSFRAVDWADLWDLFLFKFLAGFSMLLFRSNFTMVLKQKFDASPKTRGYMMSYGGTVGALCGFGVGRLTKRYSSMSQVCQHMLLLQTLTLLALILAPSTSLVFVFLTPLSLVTAMQRVVVTDLTIRRGSRETRGSLMGLSHSIMSMARMLAPSVAGLAQQVHLDGASVVAMVASVCAAALIYVRPQDPEKRRQKTE